MTSEPTPEDPAAVLAAVGQRLRRLRIERGLTLAALEERTGISSSTLSRLESGKRRANLELLLPISHVYGVGVDELIGARQVPDPRSAGRAIRNDGSLVQPLTRQPGGLQAFKMTLPRQRSRPRLQQHDGYEWLYVLSGRCRLVLAHHDLVLGPGEAAEFDTNVPHWFGSTGDGPVEILSLFGPEGQRMHVRAGPREAAP